MSSRPPGLSVCACCAGPPWSPCRLVSLFLDSIMLGFVDKRSNLFFGRRSDLARRSETLQFESRPAKMFGLCSRLNHVPYLSDL